MHLYQERSILINNKGGSRDCNQEQTHTHQQGISYTPHSHTHTSTVLYILTQKHYEPTTVLEFRTNLWGQEPSRNRVVVPARQVTQADGIESLKSIPGLLKSLIIPPLEQERRKIRLIENIAKCRHLKKLTCKGTLGQVFICLRPPPILGFCLGWCSNFVCPESGQNSFSV